MSAATAWSLGWQLFTHYANDTKSVQSFETREAAIAEFDKLKGMIGKPVINPENGQPLKLAGVGVSRAPKGTHEMHGLVAQPTRQMRMLGR